MSHARESDKRRYSPSVTGFLGLNTIPSARMDESFTMRATTSYSDPYSHGAIGIQLANPLYIQLRQSAESSDITDDPDRLYPGVDIKLRLAQESALRPAITLGMQSAIGHKRSAGEFVALSKRYKDLDFTAGLGWGRYGTANHFKNPLRAISSHFDKQRSLDDEDPNDMNNWFTGESVGFFGGFEYFTPYEGLSLKFDYGADRYSAEQSNMDFDAPSVWSAGLSYSPTSWINAGLAAQGTNRVIARLTMQSSPAHWPLAHRKYTDAIPDHIDRPKETHADDMEDSLKSAGITITNIEADKHTIKANIHLDKENSPQAFGRAAHHIFSHSAHEIEELYLTPYRASIKGRTIKISRHDVEKSLNNHGISTNEIWKNTEFIVTERKPLRVDDFLPTKGIKSKLSIHLQNDVSLSEEDSGTLYRTAVIAKASSSPFLGFFTTGAMRLNIDDNLDNLEELRLPSLVPVRSDIAQFTKERISVDHTALHFAHSITPDLHFALSGGYLEEIYAGLGGQILYRPFGSRLALGLEGWRLQRRTPSAMNLSLSQATSPFSGHADIWYDMPYYDVTLKASVGRFLAGDTGLSFGMEKIFDNGAKLNGEIAISNYSDADLFGSTTHNYHKISLSLPLGSLPYIPEGSTVNTNLMPLGRDSAQRINKPIDLYEMSENMTLHHMARHWGDFLK